MSLGEAIEILKNQKDICNSNIANGSDDKNNKEFSQAVDVVTDWIDKMYCALMRLN